MGKHVAFKKGADDIGYGLEEDGHRRIRTSSISFDGVPRFLETYTPEYVEKVSGVPAAKIRELAGCTPTRTRRWSACGAWG